MGNKKTVKGVQKRTQRAFCSIILAVSMLFGEITSHAVLAEAKENKNVVACEESQADFEKEQLPEVETGSLEENVFLEKTQTDLGWIVDDTPDILKEWQEKIEPQETEQVESLEKGPILIQEIENVKNYSVVTCNRLNFRKGPGVKHQIKKVLTRGNVCEILSRTKSGWYHVKEPSSGITGYVCGQYMKEISERTALKERKKQEKEIKAAQRAEKARREAEKKLEEEASKKSFEGVKLQHSKPYKITPNPLNRRMGEKEYRGHRETYYSQKVLPGGGLSIPGRHVASDGTIRDKNGFICVAAHEKFMKYGSKLLTSLGPAKVYDTGCSYRTIDVYVNW